MPVRLNDVYEEAIGRIRDQPEDYSQLIMQSLSWISYAKRPLKIDELLEALAVSPEDEELDPEALVDEE